ncbi:hypothetical protein NDU88_001176 [Pleurodeles waltl]|uniref:Uncharacterized protein n=1 Tax=Pleurodeles waltl TaxID=8319 RepID=A0AAV7P2Y0_PLEWA|nr:hypothetical protein NDU88_001176 [Pleurodeles waltl]
MGRDDDERSCIPCKGRGLLMAVPPLKRNETCVSVRACLSEQEDIRRPLRLKVGRSKWLKHTDGARCTSRSLSAATAESVCEEKDGARPRKKGRGKESGTKWGEK